MTKLIHRYLAASASTGQVLVIALAAMLVLLFMLGLAIDGGRGYWERRQTQNAAEHAALAAAWETCHNTAEHDDWEDAARDAAADNGFVHNGTDVWVTPTNTSGLITVSVRSQLETTFATLMGFETIAASGRAAADCRSTSGNGFAIFAGGETCDDAGKFLVDIAGSENVITGRVHSNLNMNVGGDDNEFDGEVTYVTAEQHHSGTVYLPGSPHPTSVVTEWPVKFILATYKAKALESPTDQYYYFTTEVKSEHVTGPGLYYSTQKIDLGNGSQEEDVTLVSESTISIGGDDNKYRPFMDNLLAFAAVDVAAGDSTVTKRCDTPGVKVSGGHNEWRGFIYAPLSQIDMSGSDTSTLIGSLIGWSVKVSGSSVNNTADPSFFAGPPVLRLVE